MPLLRSRVRRRRRLLLLVSGLAVLPLLGAGGCGSPPPELKLTSLSGGRQTYRGPFTHAYASRKGGDLDVFLLDDAANRELSGDRAATSVRQIMHVRVLWQPTREAKADHPSATNATLHWYVLGRDRNLLAYAGTGFVSFSDSDGQTELSISNATVKPEFNSGLNDPIGASKVEGTALARTDDQRVARLLADERSLAAGPLRAADASLPPSPAAAPH